jgi:hypothetical protein
MRKSTCTPNRTTPFRETLILGLVLVFASQLAFAGATRNISVSPSQPADLRQPVLSTNSTVKPFSFSLISPGAELLKVNDNASSRPNRQLARKLVSRAKSLFGAKGVKSRKHRVPDCQGCKDGCLEDALDCIALTFLGMCEPCAVYCLVIEVRCMRGCPCGLD